MLIAYPQGIVRALFDKCLAAEPFAAGLPVESHTGCLQHQVAVTMVMTISLLC